ncbi:hypothetical protein TYRP_020113 [Tyrophagus putrescentiae]|nr:hypothetical protein TYRP_020113 [Tyrophagus putrescentiae]
MVKPKPISKQKKYVNLIFCSKIIFIPVLTSRALDNLQRNNVVVLLIEAAGQLETPGKGQLHSIANVEVGEEVGNVGVLQTGHRHAGHRDQHITGGDDAGRLRRPTLNETLHDDQPSVDLHQGEAKAADALHQLALVRPFVLRPLVDVVDVVDAVVGVADSLPATGLEEQPGPFHLRKGLHGEELVVYLVLLAGFGRSGGAGNGPRVDVLPDHLLHEPRAKRRLRYSRSSSGRPRLLATTRKLCAGLPRIISSMSPEV